MKKYNTFNGVFIPSFEAILGAVLFLILPYLTGAMGFGQMTLIIIIANSATLATAYSIADCTTNLRHVGAGGMYAIAKRSLGNAFGGSIGIQLFFAQALSIGFYAIGFTEALYGVLKNVPQFMEFMNGIGIPEALHTEAIATAISFLAFIIALIGADFIVRIQFVIFIVLTASVGVLFVAPFLGVSYDAKEVFQNSVGFLAVGSALKFWGAFAQFFPAVTGIDAGVGMSGNLKDPRKSLPLGTFWAIGITFVVYLAVSFIFSMIDPELLAPKADGTIRNVLDIFSQVPSIHIILLVGILVATGSSALSYFMTAPRTAQALAKDHLLPRAFNFLRLDFKKGGTEPRWATFVTFLIFLPILWLGDVTLASTVVGISFLVVYGWVNLAAFLERISGNPSFRPTFRGHWLVSFYGFAICMVGIALFSIEIGVAMFALQITIFLLLLRYKTKNRLEGVWWGVLFSVIQWGFRRMGRIIQGTKNWRPIVGVFAYGDKSKAASTAFEMASKIGSFKGLTVINVIKPKGVTVDTADLSAVSQSILESAQLIDDENGDVNTSILSICQSAVPGGFQLNTVLLPMDKRINLLLTVEKLIESEKHVLMYKHGVPGYSQPPRIDVWWKGEENGNLMALLAFMINQSDKLSGIQTRSIRILRKLFDGEDANKAEKEMTALLEGARLAGEVQILKKDNKSFLQTIKSNSSDASLIIMGMPGERANGIRRFFSLDEVFFTRQFKNYESLPPMLFVKAAFKVDLFE